MAILISCIALVVAILSLLVGYFFSFLSFYDGFLNQVYSCEKDFKSFKRAFYNFQTKANEYYELTGESLLGNDEVDNLKTIIKEMEVSLEKTKKDF
ncbi:hypothetical protein [Vreelandella nanhaiensis]|uniref:Uncharacterized protein n=1 Tax=Vreelandella nanhaiensis TaxID=1258546 RepID=A0A3S0W6I3_9GAMM|nr:hypothetical protein [Halomonas nanhaiensis]RUR33093.1 hypothetical protein ELY38_05945 [Halomonas nanhaiensis]